MRAALALAREMRPHLAGPPRARWYDLGEHPPASSLHDSEYRSTSPMGGTLNPVAPPLLMQRGVREDGKPCLIGRARLPRTYEGPPHGVHGGIVAALFDELLGAAQGLSPPGGVTARLQIRYRELTPLDCDLCFEGWIVRDHGRRIEARATCHAGETLTAQATALFVRVDFEEIKLRMRERGAADA